MASNGKSVTRCARSAATRDATELECVPKVQSNLRNALIESNLALIGVVVAVTSPV